VSDVRTALGIFGSGDGWVHRGNIIREVCTYHGGYFDWAWNGGQTITAAKSWYDQGVADEVALAMAEVRTILATRAPIDQEEVVFEDATRKVITGVNAAAFKPKQTPDPLLTRVLRLSHVPVGAAPFKLHVALIKGIQMVCDRVKDNVSEPIATIAEVRDEGQSAIIRGIAAAHRPKILAKANDAVTDGFLTGANSLSEGRVLVSVRVGGPTEVVSAG
jgi:pyruvate-formate lyase